MLLRKFIAISLVISVCYAGDGNENYNDLIRNFDSISHEGAKCEDKLTAALFILKTEMLYNYSRLDTLWKQNVDIEQSIHGKFHKLEKNVLDKLEEYIEGKLDSLEKHISRKIEAMEKNIPDKTDITIINHKFDALNKISELDEGNFTNVEDSLNRKLSELNKVIPDLENKIEGIDKKIPKHFEDINLKLDAMEKQIMNIANNSYNRDTLKDTLAQILSNNLNEIQKKTATLEQNKVTLEASQNGKKKNVLLNQTKSYRDCKKLDLKGYNYNVTRLDSDTFNFVTLETDENGLANFEIRFALKGKNYAFISLSPVKKPTKDEGYFLIQMDNSRKAYMRLGRPKTSDSNTIDLYAVLSTYDTPASVVTEAYVAYYIKIKNRTLEFGKIDAETPIIKYTDGRLRTVQYIGFASWKDSETTYLYDCPPHFEETLF